MGIKPTPSQLQSGAVPVELRTSLDVKFPFTNIEFSYIGCSDNRQPNPEHNMRIQMCVGKMAEHNGVFTSMVTASIST